MDFLRIVLLLIHLLGYAALVGGILVQLREPEKKINSLMRDGAGTVFVSGLLLVGVLEGILADAETGVNHAKVGVKLVIALVILALVMMNLRKPKIPNGLFFIIAGLTLVNLVIALFWSPSHEYKEPKAADASSVVLVQR